MSRIKRFKIILRGWLDLFKSKLSGMWSAKAYWKIKGVGRAVQVRSPKVKMGTLVGEEAAKRPR